MAARERTISANIVRWLNQQPHTFAFAITGGQYMRRGLPDIIATVRGRTLALEVKQPGKKATELQLTVLLDLDAAGAVARVVTSLDDAKVAYGVAAAEGQAQADCGCWSTA